MNEVLVLRNREINNEKFGRGLRLWKRTGADFTKLLFRKYLTAVTTVTARTQRYAANQHREGRKVATYAAVVYEPA